MVKKQVTKGEFILFWMLVQLALIATVVYFWGVFSIPFWIVFFGGMVLPRVVGPRVFEVIVVESPDS